MFSNSSGLVTYFSIHLFRSLGFNGNPICGYLLILNQSFCFFSIIKIKVSGEDPMRSYLLLELVNLIPEVCMLLRHLNAAPTQAG
jgi:hypothetical protein